MPGYICYQGGVWMGRAGNRGDTCTISTRSCAIILPHCTFRTLKLKIKRGSELDLCSVIVWEAII